MAKLARLWNPRSNNRLRRHWVGFKDRILIGGEMPEQAGVLTLLPLGCDGLLVRLQVMERVFREVVEPGNDIVVWINGLELLVGLKALEDERMLVAFGVARGSSVEVTLEADAEPHRHALAAVSAFSGEGRETYACPVGLCQMRN
ncbi:MAG: hypothetical protein WC830_13170 [Burkholderiales bacterium]|jgi:hypothetical protein